MSDILFQYEKVNPTSWAYLSSLLMLALFFKFNRVFSVRNVDLFLLISLAPGLLLVQYSYENEGFRQAHALEMQKLGFLWLFAVGGMLLFRLLIDPTMVRRPLLEPNLNSAGLSFLGSSLLFFLMANVVTGRPSPADLSPAVPAAQMKAEAGAEAVDTFETEGPGYWLLYLLPRISTQTVISQSDDRPPETEAEKEDQQKYVGAVTVRVVAIISQVMIVAGLVLVGSWHFENLNAGIAAATMYLLLPYTARWCGSIEHCLPASLLVWAVVLYRRPFAAGILIGLASGTIYYPIFLLPLWCSFYWERGVKRFAVGFLIAIGVLIVTLYLTAGNLDRFLEHLRTMFGVRLPRFEHLQGIWREGFWNSVYRIPVLISFCALAVSFTAWPSRKNLGVLISCTAALMVGAQFWHAHGGGMYVAWYLPLLLLTIQRPNLEDRVALTMVSEGWWEQRQKARAVPRCDVGPTLETKAEDAMNEQPGAEPTPSNASRWLMNLFGACIALAIVLWFFIPLVEWGGSDPPLITERAKWPPAVEQLLQGAELAPEAIAAIEVTPHADGYFLRMPATEATVAFVESRFKPVDEAKAKEPRVAEAIGQFWDHLPHRWRSHKPRDDDRFFMDGDGSTRGVARVNSEDGMVLIWHRTPRQQ